MTVEIREPREEEFERFGQAIAAAFSEDLPPAEIAHARQVTDIARTLAAYEGNEIVGTAASFLFETTVPGNFLPTAGVTYVGVRPDHTRRGILTALMRRLLDDAHSRGEPVATLWASEGGIYGRFGFGLATRNATIEADRVRATFAAPSEPEGRLRLVSHEEALRILPAIYDRVRRATSGFHSRTRAWWEHGTLPDEEFYRDGAGPLSRAVLELDGQPSAYALYRVKDDWEGGFPSGTLLVQEEVSTSPIATRELWRFLLGVDLVAVVRGRTMPPDHPIFLLVAEPARLRFRLGDGLWLRLLDARAALEARSYAAEGRLVVDLSDPFCPWNEGRLAIDASREGVIVRRVRSSPHLRLGVAELGSLYLGGLSACELAWAGRIEESRRGGLALADALFRTERAPWSPELF